jgi:hypothetical protein
VIFSPLMKFSPLMPQHSFSSMNCTVPSALVKSSAIRQLCEPAQAGADAQNPTTKPTKYRFEQVFRFRIVVPPPKLRTI